MSPGIPGRRIRWPWRSAAELQQDVDEEIQFHLDMRAHELMRAGLSSDDARVRAIIEFGDVSDARRKMRASDEHFQLRNRMARFVDDAGRDVKLALRGLRRQPAFAVTVVLILGLGIGMATSMFTVFDSVLIRELPVRDQNRLIVASGKGWGTIPHLPIDYNSLLDLRKRSRALREIAGVDYIGGTPQLLRDRDRLVSISIANTTGNFFEILGARPFMGRLMRAEDDVAGITPVVVLSYGAWQRYFGGDAGAIGRHLTLSGFSLSYTVIGIAPPGLDFPAGAEAWAPDRAVSSASLGTGRMMALDIVGRLAPHASGADVRSEYDVALKESNTDAPFILPHLAADVRPLREVVLGNVQPAIVALTLAVALLLLIASANVGNLMLVRASGRVQEMAIRRVLGAGFRQLIWQLSIESLVLGMLGGCLGFVLAREFLRSLVALAPPEVPRLDVLEMSGAPVGKAVAITLLATAMFGLAPAFSAARRDLGSPLRAGARAAGQSKGARRVRQALVAWQVALALIVLVGAGLVGRSLVRLERIDLGFDAEHLALVQFAWPWDRAGTVPTSRNLIEQIVARVEEVHGVLAASPVHRLPFAGTQGVDFSVLAEGQSETGAEIPPVFNVESAGPDYFRALDLPIRRGRAFVSADREGAPKVVIVSESVARRLWPRRDPIGKRVRFNDEHFRNDWATVVGIVSEAHYRSLRQPAPTLYYPYRQLGTYAVRLIVRTGANPNPILRSVRSAVAQVDPGVRVWRIDTMDQLLAAPLAQPRLNALLLSAFGFASLLLAAIGLYGIMAASVRQQTRELGIRAALGATPARLRNLVLSQAFLVTGTGALVGLIGALAATRLLRGLLFEISPNDPVTLLGVSILLLAVALLAAYIPARRATRVDPAECLRAD